MLPLVVIFSLTRWVGWTPPVFSNAKTHLTLITHKKTVKVILRPHDYTVSPRILHLLV